jgi:hypothetical protein
VQFFHYYKETLFNSEKNVFGLILNDSIKRDKGLSQDFKEEKFWELNEIKQKNKQ